MFASLIDLLRQPMVGDSVSEKTVGMSATETILREGLGQDSRSVQERGRMLVGNGPNNIALF